MNCPTCHQSVHTIPEQPRNMVSYKVAKTMLKGILDLDEALEEHLACQVALGLLKKKDVTKRRALLKTATISEEGIRKAKKIKKPLVALFRTKELQPWQAFDLLKQVGVQTHEGACARLGFRPCARPHGSLTSPRVVSLPETSLALAPCPLGLTEEA